MRPNHKTRAIFLFDNQGMGGEAIRRYADESDVVATLENLLPDNVIVERFVDGSEWSIRDAAGETHPTIIHILRDDEDEHLDIWAGNTVPRSGLLPGNRYDTRVVSGDWSPVDEDGQRCEYFFLNLGADDMVYSGLGVVNT